MRANVADWVALNMVRGIGPRTANQLIDRFETPSQVFTASRLDLELAGLKPETIDELRDPKIFALANVEIEQTERLGARIITRADVDYPSLLSELYDPPIVLYVRGDLATATAQPCLAVVGSRRASTYGLNAAERLARDLAERGLTITSGLARGVDASAHRGALAVNGLTIAVIGTGIEATYPKEHARLADEIAARGSIVSEFPLSTPPLAQNFPYRNRVLSGLCFGILIIEAAEHSGSLITARLAAEQGREVFALPGQITSPNAFGPNLLIKDGAKLVQGWQDVIEELPREIKEVILVNERDNARDHRQPSFDVMTLSESERQVLALLALDAPMHIDELIIASKLSSSELMNTLLELEMKDRIQEFPGKAFIKKL